MASSGGSSPGGDDSQSVNPYAASQVGEPRLESSGAGGESAVRRYTVRLNWQDRAALLRSVAPTRLIALMCIAQWVKHLFELLREWLPLLGSRVPWEVFTIGMFPLAILYLVSGTLAIYANWLGWKYATLLRQAAGGVAATFTDWTQMHYRTAWWTAVATVLAIVIEVGTWFVYRMTASE